MGFLYNYMTIEKFANLVKTNKWIFSDVGRTNDFRERGIDYYSKFEKENRGLLKFACFSSSWKIAPMWYFYSGNYTGVCVEFSIEKLKEKYKDIEIEEIKYMPISDPKSWQSNIATFKDYLSIKTLDWAYEHEIRLFYTGEDDSLFGILSCISKVYTGHDCILNQDNVNEFSSMIAEGKFKHAHFWPDGDVSSW